MNPSIDQSMRQLANEPKSQWMNESTNPITNQPLNQTFH